MVNKLNIRIDYTIFTSIYPLLCRWTENVCPFEDLVWDRVYDLALSLLLNHWTTNMLQNKDFCFSLIWFLQVSWCKYFTSPQLNGFFYSPSIIRSRLHQKGIFRRFSNKRVNGRISLSETTWCNVYSFDEIAVTVTNRFITCKNLKMTHFY